MSALDYDAVKNDWRYIDGVEDVTFAPLNRDGDPSPVEDVKAKRSGLGKTDLQLLAATAQTTEGCVWNLWASTMGGQEARAGDEITTAGGTVWIVGATQLLTLGSRWRCVCTRKR